MMSEQTIEETQQLSVTAKETVESPILTNEDELKDFAPEKLPANISEPEDTPVLPFSENKSSYVLDKSDCDVKEKGSEAAIDEESSMEAGVSLNITPDPNRETSDSQQVNATKGVPKIKILISGASKSIGSLNDTNTIISSSTVDKIDGENLSSSTNPEKCPNANEKSGSNEQYAENVTYTEDGTAIYTDPKTQYTYKWSDMKNDWIPTDKEINSSNNDEDKSKKSNPYENEHYRWCSKTNQWIPKNTEQTSNVTETEHYRWDAEKNEWIMKNQAPSLDDVKYGYEDGVRIYTDKDGMVFFWDEEKKAWFPKIDEDFMARYQMSYGFIDNTSAPPPVASVEDEKKIIAPEEDEENLKKIDVPVVGVKRKAPPEPPKWFDMDQSQNTKVYVSNLPLDITIEEFSELMCKCGMIMKDPQTQKQKLKLYSEKDGQLKGDGLCDYIKVESVDLALKLLDESFVRGNKIKVQRAKFQMKGEYNPTLKPKKKKKDKEKLIKLKEKLFDWRPEKMRGERSKHERTVIIKNLFTPELFDKEVHLILEYQNDLREECSKCGIVRKVVVYDRHPDGVAQVNMADPEQADLVIQMMNGRFFGQRKLTAETWDGKTKYKIFETEEEVQARINKWDKYLETAEEKTKEDDDVSSVHSTEEKLCEDVENVASV